jgi:hypothetical protein
VRRLAEVRLPAAGGRVTTGSAAHAAGGRRPAATRDAHLADGSTVRPLTAGMRRLLVVAAVLVVLAGVQLFVFPLRTDEWFAWPVAPPFTAVFLGAAYWSSAPLELVAARARPWADARIAVPSVFVFTVATLLVTIAYRDRFHFGAPAGTGTRLVTWIWLAIYVIVPILLAVVWVRQQRVPGDDPPRTAPLGPVLLGTIAAQGSLFVVVGTLLLARPTATGWWPWELTELTARAVGAWILSLGVAALHACWERDARRVRPAAVADVTFVVLQTVALIRHGDDLDWSSPGAAALVVVLVAMAVIGTRTLWIDWRAP